MKEYIIVGDTKEYKDCLIYVCGDSIKHTEKILNRMLNNPTKDDEKVMIGLANLRIKEVNSEDCWWNYNCD